MEPVLLFCSAGQAYDDGLTGTGTLGVLGPFSASSTIDLLSLFLQPRASFIQLVFRALLVPLVEFRHNSKTVNLVINTISN